jgi:hypothetical protein
LTKLGVILLKKMFGAGLAGFFCPSWGENGGVLVGLERAQFGEIRIFWDPDGIFVGASGKFSPK